MRAEANRSTPSLLSQTSPTRRSSSPLVHHQTNGSTSNDWPRKNGPASINTSPARSTLSLTSTVNLPPGNIPASATTTPGKISTPIYYDYTEDFEVDEYTQTIPREPPPQFLIESSIPEDRPTSTEQPPLADLPAKHARQSINNGSRRSSSAESVQIRLEAAPELEPGFVNGRTQWPVRKTSLPLPSSNIQAHAQQLEPHGEKKVFRLSRLGYGARELNSHVAEAFGLAPSESFEMPETQKSGQTLSESQINVVPPINGSNGFHVGHHIQHPSHSPPVGPPQSGKTQDFQGLSRPGDGRQESTQEGKGLENFDNSSRVSLARQSITSSGRHQLNGKERRASSLDFTSARAKRARSSGFNSVDTGYTELAELISSLESANRTQSPDKNADVQDKPAGHHSRLSPIISDQNGLRKISSGHKSTPPVSAFNQQCVENPHTNTQQHHSKQTQVREPIPDVVQDYVIGDMPNFSHQIPRKSVSRSGSPMLAPKPISPARQLKLKNSVPQLMKALPPVPPDPPVRAVLPPQHMTSNRSLPFHFSPLLKETRAAPTRDLPSIPEPDTSPKNDNITLSTSPAGVDGSRSNGLPLVPDKKTQRENSLLPPSPAKLKLKARSTAASGSKFLNSEENPLEPLHSQINDSPTVQTEKSKSSNPPKFKLKITRASVSSEGTIRINRESGSSNLFPSLRSPKDLFTPSAGLDNIFRQVGRHLHPRKTSTNNSHGTPERSLSPHSNQTLASDGTIENTPSHSRLKANSADARSFFSDTSSNLHGRHSLRKRISNIRARITVPYSSRVVSQSLEEIPLRSRTQPDVARSPAGFSVPNLHVSRSSTEEDTPLRNSTARALRLNLREKVSKWLKGARSAIAARVRSRNSSTEGR